MADAEPAFHSLTRAPNPRPDTRYRARFFNDHAEFEAHCAEFESQVEVWVSPDDDVEFRRVTLHNLSDDEVEFELLSLFEAALCPQRADESHPAFSNLFVQAHAGDERAVLLERRARLHGESGMWAAHFLAACDCAADAVSVTCDRARILPRLGHAAQARPGTPQQPLPDGRLDTGLDPVASLTVRVTAPARARLTLTFATAAAADSDTLMAAIDEYRQDMHLTRSRMMAATLARIRQRELRIDAAELHAIEDLTTLMLTSRSRQRAAPASALDRRALWRFGISGDRPIVVLRLSAMEGLPVVRALLAAHRLWEIAGLASDLVVINGEPSSYLMPLQLHIAAMRHAMGSNQHAQPDRGNVHVLRQPEFAPNEIAALHACARIDLVADGRPLSRLLEQAIAPEPRAPGRAHAAVTMAPPWPEDLAHNTFQAGGREFAITVTERSATPRPWANVIANAQFGCLVTEAGGGFTWAHNSRMNQLSGWSNDALLDPPCEHFLVQDTATHELFGLLPTLDRNGSAGYHVTHTQGMSTFAHERGGLAAELRISVHPQESVKCLEVRLRNNGTEPRALRLLGLVEWVMGAQRQDRMTLATEFVPEVQALLARQLEHQGGFGEGTAFLMLAGVPVRHWTCARSEFFDSDGYLSVPDALGGAHGFGLDPCAALDALIELDAGGELGCFWVIGYAPGRNAAISLARRMRVPGALAACASLALEDWDRRLSAIEVHTPDPLFDALVNRWLLYQAVGCRMWAKAGFYQASGATGFRDQLQDAMALAYAEPQALREQILLHATRQFPEGDVQHWWHSPTGAGVRTHFSDDLLWLPYVTQHYLEVCSDVGVLDVQLPFLEGPEVPADAEDAYYVPTVGGHPASLYEHAARAIDHGLRFGAHGLPLMGTGDWNDGMNRVGHEGRGESVWLGWFLLAILRDWVPRARSRGDDARADRWALAQQRLDEAMRQHGWDGSWYRRAYFDNGQPLGSQLNDECRIDLIAQAWSVFVAPPDDARARQAMASADSLLVDRRTGLVRLLHPPLQQAADNAGYIQAYPPGVRENGGQYSHGAVWALMAQAQLGHADLAWEYFRMLSPAHRARTEVDQRRYRIEPYVMPGDTYAWPPYEGRGGWSWYSGSAAWMYRAAVESILGLVLRADRFCMRPCLPPAWTHARMTLRLHGKVLHLLLRTSEGLVEAPPDARRAANGEWIGLAALPPECTLVIEVPPASPLGAGRSAGAIVPA
jgi:cyclic beta-1,2-glucan synthetase